MERASTPLGFYSEGPLVCPIPSCVHSYTKAQQSHVTLGGPSLGLGVDVGGSL